MIETIKKSFIWWIVFTLTVMIIWITYAAVSSWDTLTADMWNNRNAPDFDSGWVAEESSTDHETTFTHNFWSLPTNIVIMTAPDNTGTRARYQDIGSPWHSYTSPESTLATTTQIKLKYHYPDHFLYCDVNNPCEWDSTTDSGYIRVLAWK